MDDPTERTSPYSVARAQEGTSGISRQRDPLPYLQKQDVPTTLDAWKHSDDRTRATAARSDSEASPFLSIPPRVLQQILSDHLYTESRLTMDARISGEVFYRHAGNHERTQTLMRFAAQLGLYDRQTRRITATGKDMVEDVQNSVPDEMIERWRDNARIPRIPFSPPWIRVEIAKAPKAIRTPRQRNRNRSSRTNMTKKER